MIFQKSKNIQELEKVTTKLETSKSEYLIKETSLKATYEEKLKAKDEQIAYYKDFKARQSTKMVGESLEVHCNTEFNKLVVSAYSSDNIIEAVEIPNLNFVLGIQWHPEYIMDDASIKIFDSFVDSMKK